MAAIPAKKYRLLQAILLVQNILDEPEAFLRNELDPSKWNLTAEDRSFLKNFLASNDLKNILTLIDIITRITQSPPKYPDDNIITNFHPLISKFRPERSEDRNCLISLNEAWNEIEGLLTKSPEKQNQDAQELYEILSDEFIRELLVAVDDTGNYRYTTYVATDSATKVLYVEKEPAYVVEESMASEIEDALDQTLSVSTLPRDDQQFAMQQSSRQQRGRNHVEYEKTSSPRPDFPHPPPRTSSRSPRQRLRSSMSTNPRRPKDNNQYLTHSLERQLVSKHAALPSYIESSLPKPGKLRTVHITRNTSGEPLGITLASEDSSCQPSSRSGSFLSLLSREKPKECNKEPPRIVIQRIIVDSLADREGKLFPGDEIVEFNGMAVNSLDAIRNAMVDSMASNVIQMVVKTPGIGQLKSHLLTRNRPEHKVYIRCLFKYDPSKDTLLPSTNLGVAFKSGDVLELVDSQDLNWWQVRSIDAPNAPVGLVPSQTLEERRQAFNQQAFRTDTSKKKIKKYKSLFRAADSSNLLVRSDLWAYEEVVPWPPSPVHTLLLIGPNGVGRRTLKFLLCTQYSQRFCFPTSDTTDPKASPSLFRIRSKGDMESDIRQGTYVEWGTVEGHHYGISFAAIREIIASGRTAVVDCQCQSVHLLHQPEFNPHVVFVSAPKFEIAKAMMDKGIRENITINRRTDEEIHEIVEESKIFAIRNQHLYTHTLVNSDMAEGVEKLYRLVTRLEQHPGWIPAGWAYEMSLPKSFDKNGHGAYHLPGMSVISGSEIPGLPNDNQSVLGRGASSMLSAASPESAFRLARPPSVCSSLQLPKLDNRKGGYSNRTSETGRWRYEKRGGIPRVETPLSLMSSTGSSESRASTLTATASTPPESRFLPKNSAEPAPRTFRTPSAGVSTEMANQQSGSANKTKTNASLKVSQRTPRAAMAEEDEGAISSTSSEED